MVVGVILNITGTAKMSQYLRRQISAHAPSLEFNAYYGNSGSKRRPR